MTQTKSHKLFRLPDWGRRYITLDRYMSGDFWRLFVWTFVLSVSAFLLIWALIYLCGRLFISDDFSQQWTLGESFVQMSNPARHADEGVSAWEWVAIVVMNMFGLFILNGVVLTLLVNWVSNRKERFTNGNARYDYIFQRHHSVIIGGHKIVASLAAQLMSDGRNEYVLIQTQRNADEVRKEIFAQIKDEAQAHNVVIYSGDRTSWHELEELRLATAREVYIIGESTDIDGTSHDAINLQCWDLITRNVPRNSERTIPCHVMFDYQSSFSAFQFTDIDRSSTGAFKFMPFSVFENWVQQVLITHHNSDGEAYYTPLDGTDGIMFDSQQRVHLIIIGMSKMGTALALEAAHIAHYPNFNNPATGRPRTLITFIDTHAGRDMLFFMARTRELFKLARWRYVEAPTVLTAPIPTIYDTTADIAHRTNKIFPWNDPMTAPDSSYPASFLGEDLIDIDFEFIQGDVALPSIQKYIADACADNIKVRQASSKTTIAVCLPVAVEAMSTAIYFEPSVYTDVQQIWVQQPDSGALIDTIRHGTTGQAKARFEALRPFGMIDKCDYLMRINSPLPKLVAYAYECMNRGALDSEFLEAEDYNRLYHNALEVWNDITAEGGKSAIAKIWSNIYCANTFAGKCRSEKLDMSKNLEDETIGRLAQVEHNRWVIEQLLLGTRPVDKSTGVTLPVEDRALRAELKSRNIHPDIVSNHILGSTGAYDIGISRIIPKALEVADYIERNQYNTL